MISNCTQEMVIELKSTRKEATSSKAFDQARQRADEAFTRPNPPEEFLVVMVSPETLQLLWFKPLSNQTGSDNRPKSDGLFDLSFEASSPGLRRLVAMLQWNHDCDVALLLAAIRNLGSISALPAVSC